MINRSGPDSKKVRTLLTLHQRSSEKSKIHICVGLSTKRDLLDSTQYISPTKVCLRDTLNDRNSRPLTIFIMVFSKFFEEAKRKRNEAPKASTEREKCIKPDNDQKDHTTSSKKRRRGKKDAQKSTSNPMDANPPKRTKPPDAIRHQKRRGPPTKEVLDFSLQLKGLLRQKRLDEAVALYWTNDTIRDEHHACIVIDGCARCGDVDTAEQIVAEMNTNRHNPQSSVVGGSLNVETQTALLKVYTHAGRIEKAMHLFQAISNPNVRTFNTLLRGCLWTAAAPVSTKRDGEGNAPVVGGVVTSEQIWQLYQQTDNPLDTSSYEYSITLLCQALRVQEAESRIVLFCSIYQIRVKGTASISITTDFETYDYSPLETLAVVYLALARAYAFLNKPDDVWRSCQRSLSALKQSRAILLSVSGAATVRPSTSRDNNNHGNNKQGGISGGKRGWRRQEDSTLVAGGESSSRNHSNVVFRTHRLSELELEVRSLLKKSRDSVAFSQAEMALRIQTRLLFFSGGASTIVNNHESAPLLNAHMITAWHSFGLSKLTHTNSEESTLTDLPFRANILQSSVVNDDGTINFSKVFADNRRPLDIELGAGFGSWVVQQALENKHRNYVAVELRADRVFQIFSRSMLDGEGSADNVCVIGCECGVFLRHRIKLSSVSTIYANFPEPPTQIYGDDPRILSQIVNGELKEPSHMLHSETLMTMAEALESKGKIIIVTDNRSYSRLLAATFAKVLNQQKKLPLLGSTPPKELKDSPSLRHLESFLGVVDVYTQENGDHGTSYFDRLWRTGVGNHSEKRTRFIIMMRRR